MEEGAQGSPLDHQRQVRGAYKHRRCVVPASGWYEWTGPKGERLPWYITAAAGDVLSFAGLWEEWQEPGAAEPLHSVTILVCPAAPELAHIHDRMPVVLSAEAVDRWLDAPDAELLVPNAVGLTAWRVSPAVNSSRYQEADAVTQIAT